MGENTARDDDTFLSVLRKDSDVQQSCRWDETPLRLTENELDLTKDKSQIRPRLNESRQSVINEEMLKLKTQSHSEYGGINAPSKTKYSPNLKNSSSNITVPPEVTNTEYLHHPSLQTPHEMPTFERAASPSSKEGTIWKTESNGGLTKVKTANDPVTNSTQEVLKHWIFCSTSMIDQSDSLKSSHSPRVTAVRSFYTRYPNRSPKHTSVPLSSSFQYLSRAACATQSSSGKVLKNRSKVFPKYLRASQDSQSQEQVSFSHGHWSLNTVCKSPSLPVKSYAKPSEGMVFPRNCISCQKWIPTDNHFNFSVKTRKSRSSCFSGVKLSKSSEPVLGSRVHTRPKLKHGKKSQREKSIDNVATVNNFSKVLGGQGKKGGFRTKREPMSGDRRVIVTERRVLVKDAPKFRSQLSTNRERYFPRPLYKKGSLALMQIARKTERSHKNVEMAKKGSPIKKFPQTNRKVNNMGRTVTIQKTPIPSHFSSVMLKNSNIKALPQKFSAPRHTILRKTSMSAKICSGISQPKSGGKRYACIDPNLEINVFTQNPAQASKCFKALSQTKSFTNQRSVTRRTSIIKAKDMAPAYSLSSKQYKKPPVPHCGSRKKRDRYVSYTHLLDRHCSNVMIPAGGHHHMVPFPVGGRYRKNRASTTALQNELDHQIKTSRDTFCNQHRHCRGRFHHHAIPCYDQISFLDQYNDQKNVGQDKYHDHNRVCWDGYMNTTVPVSCFCTKISAWPKQGNKGLHPSLASGHENRKAMVLQKNKSVLQKSLNLAQRKIRRCIDEDIRKHNILPHVEKSQPLMKQIHTHTCRMTTIPPFFSLLRCINDMSAPLATQAGVAESTSRSCNNPVNSGWGVYFDYKNSGDHREVMNNAESLDKKVSVVCNNFSEAFALVSIVDTEDTFTTAESIDSVRESSSIEENDSSGTTETASSSSNLSSSDSQNVQEVNIQNVQEEGNNNVTETVDNITKSAGDTVASNSTSNQDACTSNIKLKKTVTLSKQVLSESAKSILRTGDIGPQSLCKRLQMQRLQQRQQTKLTPQRTCWRFSPVRKRVTAGIIFVIVVFQAALYFYTTLN